MAPRFSSLAEALVRRAHDTPDRLAFAFLEDGEQEVARWTYAGLHARAAAFARRLQEHTRPGDPVVIFPDEPLPFIEAFFGCVYAGAIATPLHPPAAGRGDPALLRLRAILENAAPRAFVVPPAWPSAWDGMLRGAEGGQAPVLRVAPTSAPAPILDPTFRPDPSPRVLLQYTSGSTGTPKGVIVSHDNLLENEAMAERAFGFGPDTIAVTWLPLFHDLGLIGNVLQPLYSGFPSIVMPPGAFLKRPRRWLAAISRYRATLSAAPNFAYELCLQRVTGELREGLDLSSWSAAVNGAEPVRADTIDRFCHAFQPFGLRRTAFLPVYGLAEATLLVTGRKPSLDAEPLIRSFDVSALERGEAIPAPDQASARRLVAAGSVDAPLDVRVVDPADGTPLRDGRVGEVWVRGPCVAAGYWRREAETETVFRAGPEGDWLRTGDLGFLCEGQLFLVGRLKDLIIVRGRNHHPADLERTAEEADPRLRRGCSAAFGWDVEVGETVEEAVAIVVELDRGALSAGADDVSRIVASVVQRVREAISTTHGLALREVVVTLAGGVLKTSSGKIRRRETRAAWLAGALEGRLAAAPAEGGSR